MPNTNETVEVHPVFPWLNAARRAWIYRLATALSALAAGYGVIDDSRGALIVAVIGAFVGVGTAAAHTPTEV